MSYRRLLTMVSALVALLLTALPAGAEAPKSSLTFNAYLCPEGYGQISECQRLDDVVLSVAQDGQEIGPLASSAAEGVSLDLLWGAAIQVEVLTGQPDGTTLEPTSLRFDAVEGENPVTLIFLFPLDAGPPPPHSDTNALVVQALVCPVDYAGNNYAGDCLGEKGIAATVTRDADGFSVNEVTGTDGTVGFQGLGEGTYTVELGVPGDAADFLTVCGTPDGFEPRAVDNPNTNRIGVYLGSQEELTCTFFIIPVDAQGEPAPSVPVTTLPTTGTASADDGVAETHRLLGVAVALALVLVGLVAGRRRTA